MNRIRASGMGFWLSAGFLSAFALYLVLQPQSASRATVAGLRISAYTVIPAVFPYLVISGTFVSMGLADRIGAKLHSITAKLFALPGCCAPIIVMGVLCGFPVGARMAGMLYEKGSISADEAQRLTACCNFCGPAYVIGVLGQRVLGDMRLGFLLFLVQTLLSLLCAVVLGRKKRVESAGVTAFVGKPFPEAFAESVTAAAESTLCICGYVTFFSVLMSALSHLYSGLAPTAKALLYGFFEMSGGVMMLTQGSGAVIAGSAIVLWSGISVLLQIRAALGKARDRISLRPYLAVRAVTVPLGAILTYLISGLFGFT